MFAYRIGVVQLLIVALVLGLIAQPAEAELTVSDLDQRRVSLSLDNAEITGILKLLSLQHDINLSVASQVEGTVTINLKEVAMTDALNVLTASVGASWYVAGDIVIVKPSDAINIAEFKTRIFELKHISATEAKAVVEPVLPEHSKTEVLSRVMASTNNKSSGWDEMLQVVTLPNVMPKVEEIILQVDRPRKLVEIETRIIETTIRDESEVGVNFPDKLTMTAGNLEVVDQDLGLPGLASYPLGGGSWTWGRLTAGEVSTVLSFLEKSGNSKLVSNPRVTTLSNTEAAIEVATTIPVETLNRFTEAGVVQDIVSFQDLDVSITMEVVPRVADDSTVNLEITTMVEEITGYTGPADNQRPITSRRSVSTTVTVRSGESLGLGGLLKEIETKNIEKVPLLGSIPLLGRLFRHESKSTEKTDLLILITPRILES